VTIDVDTKQTQHYSDTMARLQEHGITIELFRKFGRSFFISQGSDLCHQSLHPTVIIQCTRYGSLVAPTTSIDIIWKQSMVTEECWIRVIFQNYINKL
jgi:hypothetical protein